MGVKLGGTLIEERDIGVGYVTFKGLFKDFCLRCCGFVCYCNAALSGSFLVVKVFFFPCVFNRKDLGVWGKFASVSALFSDLFFTS